VAIIGRAHRKIEDSIFGMLKEEGNSCITGACIAEPGGGYPASATTNDEIELDRED
jgi:hypothetical protein